MNTCIFCQIVAGQASHHLVNQTADHLAILDIFPNTEATTVVITKKHLPSNFALNAVDDINQLVNFSQQVAGQISRAYPTVNRSALIFEGFGVDHLHCRLLPLHGTNQPDYQPPKVTSDKFFRHYLGYIDTRGPAQPQVADQLMAVATKLRRHQT